MSRIALGALVALLPWVSWPQWPTHEPLVDLKWPVAAWGLLLVVALSFFERARALAPRDLLSASWMPLFLGAFLIAAGLALSSLLSPTPLLSWRISLREMMFISVACRLAMLRTPARVSLAVLGAYMGSAALQAAWTLWQWTGRGGEAGGRGAMIGTLGNPEYAANWMAPALALAIIWLGSAGVRPLWRGALLLVVGLVGSSIFLSGGRGAAVGVVVSIAIVAAMRRRRKASARESRGGDPERASTKADSRLPAEALAKPRPGLLGLAGRGLGKARRYWPGLTAVALLAILLFALRPSPFVFRQSLVGRMAAVIDPYSISIRHRIGLVVVTSHMIFENPIVGVGPGRFGAAFDRTRGELARTSQGVGSWVFNDVMGDHSAREAHNDYLQWWAEYGLLPLIGLIVIISATAVRLRRAALSAGAAAPGKALSSLDAQAARLLLTALIVLFVGMVFSFPLHRPARAMLFWALIGLSHAGGDGHRR